MALGHAMVEVGCVGQLLGGEAAGDQLEEAAELRGGRLVHLPALLHLHTGEMSGIVRQDWDLIGSVIEVSFFPSRHMHWIHFIRRN